MGRMRIRLKGVIEPIGSALYQWRWVRTVIRVLLGGETYQVMRDGKMVYTPRPRRGKDCKIRRRQPKVAISTHVHG